MAKINAINNKSAELTIDPGASGDSFLQFDINGTGEFRVGVDALSLDSFKISQGSDLGTSDTFKVSADGEITKPLQPAFGVDTNDFINNVTGDGTIYTVVWTGGEYFDQNNDFDGTSTFTATVDGKYRFNTKILFDTVTSTNTSGFIQIVTSNRTYRSCVLDYGNAVVTISQGINVGIVSALVDMEASDTATVQVMIGGGTKIVDVGFTNRGYFNGGLIC